MSDNIPPKAAVYVPACYIMIRSGYEVAEFRHPIPFQTTTANPIPHSAPYPCLPPKDENPQDKLLTNPASDTPTIDNTTTPKREVSIETNFQKLQETLSQLSSQIASLAESHSRTEDHILRLEKLCREKVSQIDLLTETQADLLQQRVETHSGQVQSLKGALDANTEKLASHSDAVNDLSRRFDDGHWFRAQDGAELGKGVCMHNVHPPPRKIDRPVVGYDYGVGDGVGGWRVDRAPGLLRC